MLNRVALERERDFLDVLLEFEPDTDPSSWPDLIEVSAAGGRTRTRLRVHKDELEVLAVALDNAVTGGDGELYFRAGATRMTDS